MRGARFAAGAITVVVLGCVGLYAELGSPALTATAYRTSARCHALADAAGLTSRRHQLGDAVCGVVDSLGQALTPATPAVTVAAPAYPLAVSANGRYLVDRNQAPFLMTGDSPQAMMGGLSEPDADMFLADRQRYGFNSVWVNLVCNDYTGCRPDGSTFDGIPPFTTPGDLATPNELYFARADRMLALAARHGMNVLLDPIETGGWLNLLRSNGIDKAYRYGSYLGQRYKDVANIVWMSGNDLQSWRDPNDDALVLAVAQGIRDTDPVHLQTIELDFYLSSSLDDANWAPLATLEAAYTYMPTYAEVLKDYARTGPRPVFMVEANYEFEHDYAGPATLRRQQYWSLLSGAAGQFYGNKYTWPFAPDWKSHLDTLGSVQIAYAAQLFAARRWYELVPDQQHTLVTEGYGTFASSGSVNDNDYLAAARTPDGRLAMAYAPSERSFTVDMRTLCGPVEARWYDPARGTYSPAAEAALQNTGSHTFRTPGRNGDGDGDWVLVLECRLP